MREKKITVIKINDMKRCKILEWLFGFHFVINRNTNEIHNLDYEHKNCRIGLMRNAKYISWRKAVRLMKGKKANGCRFCLRKWDTG